MILSAKREQEIRELAAKPDYPRDPFKGYRQAIRDLLKDRDASRAQAERAEKQRDELFQRLEADPERAAIAALDGLSLIAAEDDAECHALLDQLGVQRMDRDEQMAVVERLRLLAPQVDVSRAQAGALAEALKQIADGAGVTLDVTHPWVRQDALAALAAYRKGLG